MVGVPLGMTSYRRRGARTAEIALVNMMVENDPTNQIDGHVFFQRPALTSFVSVGTGPIRGVFRRFGVLSSVYLVASRAGFYSVSSDGVTTTTLGTITGTDNVVIDGSGTKAIIVANGTAYYTAGVANDLTAIVMPNGVSVSSVVYISGYFILTVEGSQHYYWLAPGDTNPDALNFASFENSSDTIVTAARLRDEVWMFGHQTAEVFGLSGNLDAPFQPFAGRLYEKGCANKNTVAVLDNTIFWVGNDDVAYRADTTPIRISDHSMEERIRSAGAASLRAWAFLIDGHSLYCVSCGTVGSFVFDVENPNWAAWKSYGQATWRAHIGTQVAGDTVIAGDDASGTLWTLDQSVSNDNGSPMERILTGGVTVIGNPQICKDFGLTIATGWAAINGTATDPLIQLRFSDDGGNEWSSWLEMPLGLQGQYRTDVVWRQLGHIVSPGRIFQVRMTDDALLRISYARMNEATAV